MAELYAKGVRQNNLPNQEARSIANSSSHNLVDEGGANDPKQFENSEQHSETQKRAQEPLKKALSDTQSQHTPVPFLSQFTLFLFGLVMQYTIDLYLPNALVIAEIAIVVNGLLVDCYRSSLGAICLHSSYFSRFNKTEQYQNPTSKSFVDRVPHIIS